MKYFTEGKGLFILVPFTIFLILYLAIGVIYLKFSIFDWTLGQRGFFVTVGLILAILGEFFVFGELDN